MEANDFSYKLFLKCKSTHCYLAACITGWISDLNMCNCYICMWNLTAVVLIRIVHTVLHAVTSVFGRDALTLLTCELVCATGLITCIKIITIKANLTLLALRIEGASSYKHHSCISFFCHYNSTYHKLFVHLSHRGSHLLHHRQIPGRCIHHLSHI